MNFKLRAKNMQKIYEISKLRTKNANKKIKMKKTLQFEIKQKIWLFNLGFFAT